MSAMADLDIRLSEHKLSDPQKNGVLELMEGGFKETRTNTINSLFKRGVIQPTSEENRPWEFTHTFAKSMGWASEETATSDIDAIMERNNSGFSAFDTGVQILSDVEEIEELLQPVGFISDEEVHERFDQLTDKLDAVDTSDGLTIAPWAQWELDLMGLKGWRNTDVWTGLSLEEIEEDIKTAKPLNRKARREYTKSMTSVYRKQFCPRPRKALKLTGAIGV